MLNPAQRGDFVEKGVVASAAIRCLARQFGMAEEAEQADSPPRIQITTGKRVSARRAGVQTLRNKQSSLYGGAA